MSDLKPRRIRIGDGVRDALIREVTSRPESERIRDARDARAEVEAMRDACIHPGLFSMHVPGDPTRFNASEHCWHCDRDIPASQL